MDAPGPGGCDKRLIPLTLAGSGQWIRVAVMRGGCGATQRLADMGLLVGGLAKVVRPSAGGPVLVETKGARLAVGYGLACKILVELLDGQPAASRPPGPPPGA